MVRQLVMGMTYCLGSSLMGQLVRTIYTINVLNSTMVGILLVAIGLSVWVLRYPSPSTEAWFMLFWVTLGLVLGVGI
jgi:hypothetical protein